MTELGSDRMSEAQRRRRGSGFGGTAERYDRVRPSCPAVLFDAVAEHGSLEAGARVLEVAPGTGQATGALLDRGWRVEAVELDEQMAAVARRRLGDRVPITTGAFEDLPSPATGFDLVFCATAFHWLDPAVRLARIAAALRPGGTAAVLWTRHVRGGTQPFFEAAQACYQQFGGDDPAMGLPSEGEVEPRTAEFTGSSLFTDVDSRRAVQEIEYGTADYLDLIATYSETIALPEERRRALLACVGALIEDRFGGRVTKRYAFDLVLARRI